MSSGPDETRRTYGRGGHEAPPGPDLAGWAAKIIGGLALLAIILVLLFRSFSEPTITLRRVDQELDRGFTLCREGKYEEGLAAIRQAGLWAHRLGDKGREGEASLQTGIFLLRRVDDSYAEEQAQAAGRGATFHPPVNAYDEAEAALRKAIELQNFRPEPHRLLGVIHLERARSYLDQRIEREARRSLKLAIEELERAVEIEPKFAEAHNDLGLAYLEIGEKEPARTEFEKALLVDADLAGAHFNLGMFFAAEGGEAKEPARQEKASKHLKRYLELSANRTGHAADRLRARNTLERLVEAAAPAP